MDDIAEFRRREDEARRADHHCEGCGCGERRRARLEAAYYEARLALSEAYARCYPDEPYFQMTDFIEHTRQMLKEARRRAQ